MFGLKLGQKKLFYQNVTVGTKYTYQTTPTNTS